MLTYAIVVATRNRLDMLTTSLPLFVEQSRPASRIVIVDRSDDHEAVRNYCQTVAATASMPFDIQYGLEANLPSQRNQGIAGIDEDVVLLPDDDSLWFPDTAERILAVYEADRNQHYGAVSANDVYAPPAGLRDETPARTARLTDRPEVARVRNWLEAKLVPQPFEVYGAERTGELRSDADADGLDYELVGTIGGYRMSFRTAVAKSVRFDPVLGSRVGYGIHEDKDMALRVLESGSLIAVAPGARVFHNMAPGKRANGFSYGFYHVLNYLYTCRKVFPESSRAMAVTRPYLRYKVFLYWLRRTNEHDQEVHRGAAAALAEYEALCSAPKEQLAARYAEIADRHN